MLYYALIGLSFVLLGIAGLQFTYMFYLERLHNERKKYLTVLEKKCLDLTRRLEDAEEKIGQQQAVLESAGLSLDEEVWVDVIEDR